MLLVVALAACGEPAPAPAFRHDHTPHHGGVVAMVGTTHLEARATPDGRVALWVTDAFRQPVSLADVTGSVTIGDRVHPLIPMGARLEADVGPPGAEPIAARVAIARAGTPLVMDFVLSTTAGGPAAAGIPAPSCAPATDGPRCRMLFTRPVTALAATPDGALAFVAAVDVGVSVWRLPHGALAGSFAPPPPVMTPAGPAHADAVTLIAVAPGGEEVLVVHENRLLVHRPDGRLLRELRPADGLVRDLVWADGGRALVFTVFYDAAAHVVRSDDGRELHRVALDAEGAAVAAAAASATVAVGSEAGTIVLLDHQLAAPAAQLAGPGAVRALAFAGRHLLSAGDDGVLRIWDVDRGSVAERVEIGTAVMRLAVAPGRATVAILDGRGGVHEWDATTTALVTSPPRVLALAWAGGRLLTGDADGRVALWEAAGASPPRHSGGSGSGP